MKKIIFGLGTGRCGTTSLANLLHEHQDIHATHEHVILPWKFCNDKFEHLMTQLLNRHSTFVCDVAFYYLPYVERILTLYPNAKFICLKRDREETIESYDSITLNRNHWTDPFCNQWKSDKYKRDLKWDDCFPKYKLDKKTALKKYWNEYYEKSSVFESAFPNNYKIFDMYEVLNSEEGQVKVFKFIELNTFTPILGIKHNVKETHYLK